MHGLQLFCQMAPFVVHGIFDGRLLLRVRGGAQGLDRIHDDSNEQVQDGEGCNQDESNKEEPGAGVCLRVWAA